MENGRRYFEYTMLYFVNAHELAHQWWGHQLIGSMTQGSNSMSETLAEDFAVKVMEKKYREENIKEVFEIRIGSLFVRTRRRDAPRAAALTSAARTLRVVLEGRAGDVRAERLYRQREIE